MWLWGHTKLAGVTFSQQCELLHQPLELTPIVRRRGPLVMFGLDFNMKAMVHRVQIIYWPVDGHSFFRFFAHFVPVTFDQIFTISYASRVTVPQRHEAGILECHKVSIHIAVTADRLYCIGTLLWAVARTGEHVLHAVFVLDSIVFCYIAKCFRKKTPSA